MKTNLHPEWIETTVHCNSCNTTFKTRSSKDKITVEICSNCHPFYTGKQKLVDVAGRVDKFRARQAAAKPKIAESKKQLADSRNAHRTSDQKLKDLKAKLDQAPATTK